MANKPLPPLVLLDGGLGTTLADRYKIKFDEKTPLWSSQLLIDDEFTLLYTQTDFAKAGADVIITATYQASYEGFAASGVQEKEAEKYMRNAVRMARTALDDGRGEGKGKVALSLGAYGATMIPSQEYSGNYDEQRMSVEGLRAWHTKRLGAFVPGHGVGQELEERMECWENVNMIAFETLPRLEEVLAAREVMGSLEAKKDFWISCVFPGEGERLPDGSEVGELVEAMLAEKSGRAQPMAIGMNCTGLGKIEGLIKSFETQVGRLIGSGKVHEWPALVVYPDGTRGEVYNTTTKQWEKVEEETKISVRSPRTALVTQLIADCSRFHGMNRYLES